MTLSTVAWSLPLVEAAEAVDEDEAGAAEAEVGLDARKEAVVEDDAGAAEAEVALEASAVVEITGSRAAEAEVGLEAQAKESVLVPELRLVLTFSRQRLQKGRSIP